MAANHIPDVGLTFEQTERIVQQAVQWLRLIIESTGAVIVGIGLVVGTLAFIKTFRRRNDARYATEGYNGVRLTLSRYLALALEFQLGADILSTAVAPTPEAIAKLGAIAVIRTGLNYFLGREMREEVGRAPLREAAERQETAERQQAAERQDVAERRGQAGGGAP